MQRVPGNLPGACGVLSNDMGPFWRHRPTSVLAVVVLAIGVGASTVVFSAVDAVLIRSSIRNMGRFVVIEDDNPGKGLLRQPLPPARFLAWDRAPELFSGIAAYETFEQTLSGLVEPQQVRVARVTPNLFHLAGIKPVEGRLMTAGDESSGPAVALVSRSFWHSRVGDSPAQGRTLKLDGEILSIVGVLPAGFDQPLADVYVPLRLPFPESRVARHLRVIAKLAEGVTVPVARERVRSAAAALESAYPGTDGGWTSSVRPLREAATGSVGPVLRLLMGAAGLVLLISCATVAGLLLVQGASRQREFAVRMALGATRARLHLQLLTESALIVMTGGIAGLGAAAWLAPALAALGFARFSEIRMDGRVLLFAAGVTAVTGIVSSAIPAVAMLRQQGASGLALSPRGAGDNPGVRLREGIVVAQVALAVILTAAASLLTVSLWRLTRVDPGFRSDHVLTAQVTFPRSRYGASRLRRFERDLTARVAALPGVTSAGVVNTLPLSGADVSFNLIIEHRSAGTHAAQLSAGIRAASPGYFEAMAIPVIAGRGLLESDTGDSMPVLVVNQTMARRFWPDGDALGRRLSIAGPDGPWLTVVGMVGDVRHQGLAGEVRPEMYLPFQQETWPSFAIVVRSAIDTTVTSQAVRRIIAGLDPELPLHDVRTLDGVVADALKQPRLQSLLVGSFAGLALILSAAGVFGVMAHSVSRRVPEIAIRMALGCGTRAALVLILRQGVRLAAAGIFLGGTSAWLMARALSGIVFGVRPNDPFVFAATLAVVSGVALTAAYLPARRVSRIDPALALRT